MKFYIDVALPVPLRQTFTYLPLELSKTSDYHIGARVKVPFGKDNRNVIGVINKIIHNVSGNFELKKIAALLDRQSVLSDDILYIVQFAANYYHHPIGEVYFSCLPSSIKQGVDLNKYNNKLVLLNTNSKLLLNQQQATEKLSKQQKQLIEILEINNNGLSLFNLNCLGVKNSTIDKLSAKNWLYIKDYNYIEENWAASNILKQSLLNLNQQQQFVVDTIIKETESLTKFICYLVYGITGSGKTEVYLHLIYQVLLKNKQVLVLLPEISLTPQTIERFKHRFNTKIAVIHSKVGVNAKTNDWLAAKNNQAKIIIGTRSAVFTPIKNLGLIIIDEEHDQSFKQQTRFRYNGRDLGVIRANITGVPIILGSATPSIESIANVHNDKYKLLVITQRAGSALLPAIKLLNIKQKKLTSGLSQELISLIRNILGKQQQVLLFLNRRGYAPVIKCNSCNWAGICSRCNVYYTVHKYDDVMICHYCESRRNLIKNCPDCKSVDLISFGVGTEQLEEYINKIFHIEYKLCDPCIRIDRDTTKGKNGLENHLKKITNNKAQILLGTQMLAKGHHFPNVTLVAILDADNSLFSTDFRAPEKLTQLLLQVAGRAGRGTQSSEVVIQTMQPEHKLLQDILHKNYWDIAQELYKIRKNTNLPPSNSWVLFRAESYNLTKTITFLEDVKNIYSDLITSVHNKVKIVGPLLAPRVKKAGLFRGQLVFSCTLRSELQKKIALLLDKLREQKAGTVRWSIDVDPMDIY